MKEKTFEENIKRIEEIIALLEENKQPLDMTTSLFEEAMNKIKNCENELDGAENKINKVMVMEITQNESTNQEWRSIDD